MNQTKNKKEKRNWEDRTLPTGRRRSSTLGYYGNFFLGALRVHSTHPQAMIHPEAYKYTTLTHLNFILTWRRGRRDQQGGSLRMRPRHCTPLGLRPAISPNVGNSGAEFLVVGVRVRAAPDIKIKRKTFSFLSFLFRLCHATWLMVCCACGLAKAAIFVLSFASSYHLRMLQGVTHNAQNFRI